MNMKQARLDFTVSVRGHADEVFWRGRPTDLDRELSEGFTVADAVAPYAESWFEDIEEGEG